MIQQAVEVVITLYILQQAAVAALPQRRPIYVPQVAHHNAQDLAFEDVVDLLADHVGQDFEQQQGREEVDLLLSAWTQLPCPRAAAPPAQTAPSGHWTRTASCPNSPAQSDV